jgi:uncharacterized protein (DUF2252 family)
VVGGPSGSGRVAPLSGSAYISGMTEPVVMGLKATVRTQSVDERVEVGRNARQVRPRTALAQFTPAADRPDPVALLAGQEDIRVQALLPLRHQRMAVSPFTFYRGSAVVMANDLATMPNSGLMAQICGDAHLSNFGMFAAPDRSIVFDINDFDETNPGPFEWDVMRLAVSFVLAGRDVKLPYEAIATATAAVGFGYRTQMATYAQMPDLEIWYDRVSVEVLQQWAKQDGMRSAEKRVTQGAAKARARDAWSAISKMTEVVDGKRQFREMPPLLMRVPLQDEGFELIKAVFEEYRDTLAPDRAQLMRRYKIIDFGHKVVGVGSVGLLAFVILLQGRDENDLLVVQVKQAVASVLEPFTAPSAYPYSGERVVAGQQIMQAASDVFLGWVRGPRGKDFYVRQLRDMKFSIDPATFNDSTLLAYAIACGRTLARAHARAGDAVAINAYLGTSAKFDKAIKDFSFAYADLVEKDYAAYSAAIAEGRVKVAAPGEGEHYRIVASVSDGITVVTDDESSSGVPATS